MNASVQFVIICECRPFNSVAVPGLLQQIQDLNRQRSYAELGHRGIFLDRIQWDDSKGFDWTLTRRDHNTKGNKYQTSLIQSTVVYTSLIWQPKKAACPASSTKVPSHGGYMPRLPRYQIGGSILAIPFTKMLHQIGLPLHRWFMNLATGDDVFRRFHYWSLTISRNNHYDVAAWWL